MKPHHLIIFTLFIFLGCSPETKNNAPSDKEINIDPQELEKLGETIELELNNGNARTYGETVSYKSIYKKASTGISKLKGMAVNKMARSLKNELNLNKVLLNSIGEDGYYSFVRQYKKKGEQHMVFALHSEQGMNFHDYLIGMENQKIVFKDMYVYVSSENMSETIHNLYRKSYPEKDNLFSVSTDKDFIENTQKIENVRLLQSRGKFQEALSVLNSINGDFKNEKLYILSKISVLGQLDIDKYFFYINSIDDKKIGKEFKLINQIDVNISQGNYKKALSVLDQIDSLVGGDSFLNLYRANIYSEMGNYTKSIQFMNVLAKEKPHYKGAHFGLMAMNSMEENYSECILNIKNLLNTGMPMNRIKEEFVLDNLAESKEYKEFLAELKK